MRDKNLRLILLRVDALNAGLLVLTNAWLTQVRAEAKRPVRYVGRGLR